MVVVVVVRAVAGVVDGEVVAAVLTLAAVADVRVGPVVLNAVVVVLPDPALPQDAVVNRMIPITTIRCQVSLMATVCAD